MGFACLESGGLVSKHANANRFEAGRKCVGV